MTMPLPSVVADGAADITGTVAAVHFRDERGFAIFSIEESAAYRVRALGYLAPEIGLRAVVRAVGTWTQHPNYGWQLQVRTLELIDHLDHRGIVAFLVAYTTHLGPVRAGEAVQRFGQRVFEVIRQHPEELCAIKGITPARAKIIQASFAAVATIADVDSWLRHIGLGKADARRVREAYGDDAARLVRENPYRLADEIDGIGFLTADGLRLMLGIGSTSPYRLHAALRYTLEQIARFEGHVYLPRVELVDRTARQLDERRATTGRWEPAASLVSAIREYVPTFPPARTQPLRLDRQAIWRRTMRASTAASCSTRSAKPRNDSSSCSPRTLPCSRQTSSKQQFVAPNRTTTWSSRQISAAPWP
jgi:hypothetical protein